MSWSREEANAEDWYDRHPEYEPELQLCENCHRPTKQEELAYLDFWACPACAEETRLVDEADRTCPVLYSQIMAASGIKAIRELVKSHADAQCATCEVTRKNVGVEGEHSDPPPLVRSGAEAA